MRNCPQTVCWNCHQNGHTRRWCTANVTRPQVCESLPSAGRMSAETDNEVNQRFMANVALAREGPVRRQPNVAARSSRPSRRHNVEDEQPAVFMCRRVQQVEVDSVTSSKVSKELKAKKVRDHLGVSAERAKHYYDLRVRPNRFRPGQWVYYYCPRRFPRKSPKWQRMYTGPFLVVRVMGPVNVKQQSTPRSQPFVSHIDKLKLCLGPHPAGWLSDGDLVGVPEPAVALKSPVEQFQQRSEGDKAGDALDQLDPFANECESPEFPIEVAREGSTSECNDHDPLTLVSTEVRDGRDSLHCESPAEAVDGERGGENEGRRPSRTRRLPRHLQDYVMRVAEYFRSAE